MMWLVALSAVATASARAAPSCDVIALPTHGDQSLVSDLRDDGHMVGATMIASEQWSYWRAAQWIDGSLVDLPALAEQRTAVAMAIDEAGTVVGFAQDETRLVRPVVWRNGKIAPLAILDIPPKPGNPYPPNVFAVGIGGQGQIIGHYGDRRACLSWREPSAEPRSIGPAGALWCEVRGIDAHGNVLMQAATEDVEILTLLRRHDGSELVLHRVLPANNPHFALMNAAGTVVRLDPSALVSVVWSPALDAQPLPRLEGMPIGMNGVGDILLNRSTPLGAQLDLVDRAGHVQALGSLDGFSMLSIDTFMTNNAARIDPLLALNARRQLAWTKHDIHTQPKFGPIIRRYAQTCQLP